MLPVEDVSVICCHVMRLLKMRTLIAVINFEPGSHAHYLEIKETNETPSHGDT